jgi:protein-tyrosine kinase
MSKIHDALNRAEQENRTTARAAAAAPVLSEPAAAQASFRGNSESFHQWSPDSERLVFLGKESHPEAIEQFRTLRTRLYQIRAAENKKVILVSSAMPGEGKSFVASNLALTLVRQNNRTALLMDFDLRKPHLHELLGTVRTPGLTDYLSDRASSSAILQTGCIERLTFIPAGSPVQDPAELITGPKFKTLVSEYSSMFDWIIIDSPPVLPMSDASLISSAVDGVLLVIGANATSADAAQRAQHEFANSTVIGTVLNRARVLTHSGYKYSDYTRKAEK